MKKLVNIRVEEELLATFDAWCIHKGWSRTQALERYMIAISKTPLTDDPDERATAPRPGRRPDPAAKPKEGRCAVHPKDSVRATKTFGKFCEECKSLVKHNEKVG